MAHEEWYFFITKIHFTFKNPGLPVCIQRDWDVLGLSMTFRNPPRQKRKSLHFQFTCKEDVIKRGSKMKPCQLVRARKVTLPSEMESGSDTEPCYSWHGRTRRCQRRPVPGISGVAKFINVSVWKDVKSSCCLEGWKLGAARSCQHTTVIIPFALHLILPSEGGRGHERWLLKRLLIFDIYHANVPFSSPLPPTNKKEKMWLSQHSLWWLACPSFANDGRRGWVDPPCSCIYLYYSR